jgi:ribonuclease Z
MIQFFIFLHSYFHSNRRVSPVSELKMELPSKLKVIGAWTKAGIESCIHIIGESKKDEILLDCGRYDSATFSAKAVLISHGHIDHAGCCINHARGKSLNHQIADYYVPPEIIKSLEASKLGYEEMNGAPIPMNIIPVTAGVLFQPTPSISVVPFRTIHRVPSQGYALYTKMKSSMLPQYEHLSSAERKVLRAQGIELSPKQWTLDIVYTGDTTFEALLLPENAFIFTAPVLILEATYLDGESSKAKERGHIHLDEIIEHAHLFQNEAICFVHLSAKYSASMAFNLFRNKLPESLFRRSYVNLASFHVNEVFTKLTDINWRQKQPGWGWSETRHHQTNKGHDSSSSSSNNSHNIYNNHRYQQSNQKQQKKRHQQQYYGSLHNEETDRDIFQSNLVIDSIAMISADSSMMQEEEELIETIETNPHQKRPKSTIEVTKISTTNIRFNEMEGEEADETVIELIEEEER